MRGWVVIRVNQESREGRNEEEWQKIYCCHCSGSSRELLNHHRWPSTVISASALPYKGATKSPILGYISVRISRKVYANKDPSQKIDFDDNSDGSVAAPSLKSFLQVGSRFGESTIKLGSILADAQVGRFRDRSAAAMLTFGDTLPVQAAGLLLSLVGTGLGSLMQKTNGPCPIPMFSDRPAIKQLAL